MTRQARPDARRCGGESSARGRPGGGRQAFLRRGGRRARGPGPGEGLRAGPGEIGDPGLPLGRDVAQRHLGSEARGGLRLHGRVLWRHPHERPGRPDQPALPEAGEAGRQVLADPQHDARQQRPRDRRLPHADRARPGRAAGLSQRRRGLLVVQGQGVQRDDPALRRPHAARRAGSPRRASWARSTSRSPPAATRTPPGSRSRASSPGGSPTTARGPAATCSAA